MASGQFWFLCVGTVFYASEIPDCDDRATLLFRSRWWKKHAGAAGLGKRDRLGPGGYAGWIRSGACGGGSLRGFALHANQVWRWVELETRSARRRAREKYSILRG